jgi:hypothetical protein
VLLVIRAGYVHSSEEHSIILLLDCVCFEHVLPSFLVSTKSIELTLSRKNNAKITMLVGESNNTEQKHIQSEKEMK